MINLTQKIKPIIKPIRANLEQKNSNLKPLAGSSLSNSLPQRLCPTDMVIPGGLTTKENFYYKMTGKMPQSVQDRWVEVKGNIAITDGDQVITVNKTIDGNIAQMQDNLHNINLETNSNLIDAIDNNCGGFFDEII